MTLPENMRIHNGCYEVKKKQKGWVNKSNFTLTLTAEVQHPNDTMYIAEVSRDDGVQGTGSFALGDVYKPKDFATALNRTTPDGGNLLMLNNTELALLVKSLIRELKDGEPQYRRELVKIAGRQEDSNIIVINPKEVVHIDAGVVGPIDHTSYVWFGKSSPRPEMERHFAVPTDVQPLRTFLDLGLKVLGPEVFGVAMLAWSAMYGLNMYSWIIQHLRHFNLPLMFGEPMVGKSLIASCAAWLNGCPNTAIASR